MNIENKTVNIFAAGNVLDPHIRIEGDCRACKGTGWENADLDPARKCPLCLGKGKASSLVRLCELITAPGVTLEYITTINEPSQSLKHWKLVIARTEHEEFDGTEEEAQRRFDEQCQHVPDEPCILYWLRAKPFDWVDMARFTPAVEAQKTSRLLG